jgi:hypothetical protein
VGVVTCSAAIADERYDDHPPPERFKLRIGTFLIDCFDTTARLDSTQYPIGTLIDLEEDFNVDASESVLRIDGFYRFNKRHRIDWTWYCSRRSGTIDTNIRARDEKIRGEFDSRILGLLGYIKFYL